MLQVLHSVQLSNCQVKRVSQSTGQLKCYCCGWVMAIWDSFLLLLEPQYIACFVYGTAYHILAVIPRYVSDCGVDVS